MSISYKPENAFVGDVIPFYENGKYYAYYLHDPRENGPGIYAENTTWYLAKTRDGLNFEDKGCILPTGNETTPYLNNYTGSVIRHTDGKYYAFFTAFNELNDKYKKDGKAVQSVMMAVGDTPEKMEIRQDYRMLGDDEIYEVYDWRDPYVFYSEEEGCYLMLLCARRKGTGYHRGGCIALCKSKDLLTWEYSEPFYEPGMYITMECPEVFRMNGRWYLVFSTFSDRFLTHYRYSDSLYGPWTIPYEDSLDCRSDYAIKTAGTDKERIAFGWIATKLGSKDSGPYEWGGTMVAHKLTADSETGALKVSVLPAVDELFANKAIPEMKVVNAGYENNVLSSNGLGAILHDVNNESFMLKSDVSASCREFGFFIGTDSNLENGYQIRISNGILSLDRWPRKEQERYQWQIDGDVPFAIETARYFNPAETDFHISVIRDNEILMVYLNDSIVMSTRIYEHKKGFSGIYVVGGSLDIKSYCIKFPEK